MRVLARTCREDGTFCLTRQTLPVATARNLLVSGFFPGTLGRFAGTVLAIFAAGELRLPEF
jgi:hypothetical protein